MCVRNFKRTACQVLDQSASGAAIAPAASHERCVHWVLFVCLLTLLQVHFFRGSSLVVLAQFRWQSSRRCKFPRSAILIESGARTLCRTHLTYREARSIACLRGGSSPPIKTRSSTVRPALKLSDSGASGPTGCDTHDGRLRAQQSSNLRVQSAMTRMMTVSDNTFSSHHAIIPLKLGARWAFQLSFSKKTTTRWMTQTLQNHQPITA